jgi:hypothetical protein
MLGRNAFKWHQYCLSTRKKARYFFNREHTNERDRRPGAGMSSPPEFTARARVRSFCQEIDRNLAVRRNPVSNRADDVAIRHGGAPARLGV